MIFTEHEIVRKEKANGGKGHIIIEHLLTKNELKEQCPGAGFRTRTSLYLLITN